MLETLEVIADSHPVVPSWEEIFIATNFMKT